MSSRIHINEAALLQYHEDERDQIYLLHFYPGSIGTNIPRYDITPEELSEMMVADALGRAVSDDTPVGRKGINYHRDRYYCNGVPRGRR